MKRGRMRPLHGKVIPKLYGYYNVLGILYLLALEPVGVAISDDGSISATLRKKMKKALRKIHSAGYLHGDIARRNFCKRGKRVFLVDLERSRRTSSEAEKAAEMNLVDSL
jgi:tRNA A-37 threonylcarbamoyl transferase component Bud32